MSAKKPYYLQISAIYPPTSNTYTCKSALYIRKRANAGFGVYFTHFNFAKQYQELLRNQVCAIYLLTSNTYLQKCPIHPQKCPICLQKKPIIYKRTLYIRQRATCIPAKVPYISVEKLTQGLVTCVSLILTLHNLITSS